MSTSFNPRKWHTRLRLLFKKTYVSVDLNLGPDRTCITYFKVIDGLIYVVKTVWI